MEPFYISPELYADKGKRFLNLIIDYLCRMAMAVGIGLALGITAALTGDDTLLNLLEEGGRLGEILLGLLILMLYYSFLEGLFGISFGKLITGTKVVTIHGEKPEFGTILARSFCRLIPFNAFSGLMGDQFWHDSISNTVVVNKTPFDREKRLYDTTGGMSFYSGTEVPLANNSDESP